MEQRPHLVWDGCKALIAPVVSAALIIAGSAAVRAQSDLRGAAQSGIIAESRFAVTDPPAQAEVVQLVVDFSSGAWTSFHTHGGQAINLVLEGEITLRQAGVDRVHRAGQAWTDSTGMLHAAGNTGAGNARLLTNFLLPNGAKQTTAQGESRLEPTILYEARFPLPALPAEAEIVQQVVDLPPGRRAQRTYNSFAASLVILGEVSSVTRAEQKTYGAGEAWATSAEQPVAEENRSAHPARVFTTYLVPRGIAVDPLLQFDDKGKHHE
jgi:quercetin dioxygenase-like cupin family protein